MMKAKMMALDTLLDEIMDQVTMPELKDMIEKKGMQDKGISCCDGMYGEDEAPEVEEKSYEEEMPEMEEKPEKGKISISLMHLGHLTGKKKPEVKVEKKLDKFSKEMFKKIK